MEEDNLLYKAAEDELIEVVAPQRVGFVAEFSVEGDLDARGRGPFSYPSRAHAVDLGRLALCADVDVVDLFGRDEVTYGAEDVDPRMQPIVRLGRDHKNGSPL